MPLAPRPTLLPALLRAAHLLRRADRLLVVTGAGAAVGAGLPTFRGETGIYGRDTMRRASRRAFVEDPVAAWSFYAARARAIRDAEPAPSHQALAALLGRFGPRGFAATTNVDVLLARAGHDPSRLLRLHGDLGSAQCLHRCGQHPWQLDVAEVTEPPTCPGCGAPARPGVLLLGDLGFDDSRNDDAHRGLLDFHEQVDGRLVVLEVGVGRVVPTAHGLATSTVDAHRRQGGTAHLVRVNPDPATRGGGGPHLAEAADRALPWLERLSR